MRPHADFAGRINQLFALIPYLRSHPGVDVSIAAHDLRMDPADLLHQVGVLMTCGVPGSDQHENLIDVDGWDTDTPSLVNDQGLTAAVDLTPTEAAVFLLALENLEQQPELWNRAAVCSAAAKLRAVVGETGSDVVYDAAPQGGKDPNLRAVYQAFQSVRRLRFTYRSATGTASGRERLVDPLRIFAHDGHTYLQAWEDGASSVKNFRLDRMRDATVVDEIPRAHFTSFDSTDPFGLREARSATVHLREEHAWLANYEEITLSTRKPAPAGWVEGKIRYFTDEWLIQFALQHSDKLRVIKPVRIGRAVSARARETLRRYET